MCAAFARAVFVGLGSLDVVCGSSIGNWMPRRLLVLLRLHKQHFPTTAGAMVDVVAGANRDALMASL